MARRKPQPDAAMPPVEEEEPTENLPVEFDPEFYAGGGMEEADEDAFALPFVAILQKNSPQVDDDSGQFIEGAKAGMLINMATKKLYDVEKDPLIVIPAYYQQRFVEWVPRDKGGGYRGEHPAPPEGVERDDRGKWPLPNGNTISDTRMHYVLICDPDTGAWEPVVITMTSTQTKKSRNWMTLMQSVKAKKKAGGVYTPATYARKYSMTTVGEAKDTHTWKGWKIESTGESTDQELFLMAHAFKDDIVNSRVQTMQPTEEEPITPQAGDEEIM